MAEHSEQWAELASGWHWPHADALTTRWPHADHWPHWPHADHTLTRWPHADHTLTRCMLSRCLPGCFYSLQNHVQCLNSRADFDTRHRGGAVASPHHRGITAPFYKRFPVTAVITAVTADYRGSDYRVILYSDLSLPVVASPRIRRSEITQVATVLWNCWVSQGPVAN